MQQAKLTRTEIQQRGRLSAQRIDLFYAREATGWRKRNSKPGAGGDMQPSDRTALRQVQSPGLTLCEENA
jgi:hypothetical protein